MWLTLAPSRADLEPFEGRLQDGMPLVLYWDPEDPDVKYEMDGILERDTATGAWMTRPVEGTARELPKASAGRKTQPPRER